MEALNDTFYISHGSPLMAIDESMPARHFLESWKNKVFPQKPKAILVISGHWETEFPTVNVVDRNDTIHDFSNKPEKMYKLKYPAPGAPDLAKMVKELLKASGFNRVEEDGRRGLDHGAWVPLMLMYPEADIPVCQLSVSPDRDGTYHYNMGKALAPLKNEGIMIFGSGSAVHNLEIDLPPETPLQSWAQEFDTWLKNALLEGRYEDVNDYEKKAPNPTKAHPTPEHLYPLHVAMGAAGKNAKAKLIHHSWEHGSLSYASYQFTKVAE